MSIARAFTTRRSKPSIDASNGGAGILNRSNTTVKGSIRNKISAPVELIHTTNMLSYNAPDLFPKTTSASSAKSDDESDSAPTTASTPPTSPDSPFPEKRPSSPEPNHLSCYFSAPKLPLANIPLPAEAPVIPQRAPSHTKKSYENLTRQRSTSRLSEQSSRSVSTKASFTFSRSSSSSSSTATSVTSHSSMLSHMPKPSTSPVVAPSSPPPPVSHKEFVAEAHPFGQELAQVSELAEEYASSSNTREEEPAVEAAPVHNKPMNTMELEEQELLRRGLRKFSAEDYLSEIRGLASAIFAEASRPIAGVWI